MPLWQLTQGFYWLSIGRVILRLTWLSYTCVLLDQRLFEVISFSTSCKYFFQIKNQETELHL